METERTRPIETLSDFLSYCKMPVFFKAEIKKMKVGDTFILGKHAEKVTENTDGICEAWIERVKGSYEYYSTFTVPSKPERPLIINNGSFKLSSKDSIHFIEPESRRVRNFAIVCRYLTHLLKKMNKEERYVFHRNGIKPLFYGVWLDSDYVTRKFTAVRENDKLIRRFTNCKKYQPVKQIEAIINIALATNQITLEE